MIGCSAFFIEMLYILIKFIELTLFLSLIILTPKLTIMVSLLSINILSLFLKVGLFAIRWDQNYVISIISCRFYVLCCVLCHFILVGLASVSVDLVERQEEHFFEDEIEQLVKYDELLFINRWFLVYQL